MKGERGRRVGRCRVRDERGQIVVLFALLIPVLLALAAIVIDVGNMYVHKKNLQTLVDAGAFAGATKFVGCSFQFGDPVAANAAIKAPHCNTRATRREARARRTSRFRSRATYAW